MANDANDEEPPSLDEFSDRLDAVRGVKAEVETPKAKSGAALGRAMRVSTELVAGLFVGGLLGVGLDKLLGVAPLFMLLGFTLGFAAGLRNVAREMAAGSTTKTADQPPAEKND